MQPTLGTEALALAEELTSEGVEELSQEQVDARKLEYALKCLSAIKAREQEFETTWWKRGEMAADIYSADAKNQQNQEVPYNILYSNTEVLLPSLYSATPKPDVRTRFKGMQLKPLPEVVERFLTIAADPANPGGESFNGAMSDAVLSSLVPGMGYVRLRLNNEKAFPIIYESGHFKTLIWGKASRWAKVPWVAFKYPMKKQAMFDQFDIDEDDQAEYEPSSEAEDEKDDCCVYEFWDKATRKVYFLCEEWKARCLREDEDPLGLENFFPTPGLLLMTLKPGKLQPVPLYTYYQNQAEELNRVTVRLNKVLSAIKVRGGYNPLLGDTMQQILGAEETENGLVAVAEAGLLMQSGGFDKQIWLLPIEKLIEVARQLYVAREACKQVIYELTGISDIIRGSSVASETATAQDLKNKWGTVRLRKMQTIVADYARDFFRMTIDCASDHVPPEKWQEIIQMPGIPSAQEKQVAQQQLQYEQQAQQQAAQMAMMTGQPPPAPKAPGSGLAEKANAPSIEEVLGKISSDMNRTFVVNIQTSSTIDLDTAQDKSEVQEFMNAMGQLLAGLQPLASLGPTGMEAAKAILMSVCQRYKFGIDIADVIGKIEPPPPASPEGPSPEEKQALQAESQFKMEELKMKQAEMQMKMQTQQQENAMKLEIAAAQRDLDIARIAAEKEKLSIDIQLAQLRMQQQKTKLAQPANPKEKTSANV